MSSKTIIYYVISFPTFDFVAENMFATEHVKFAHSEKNNSLSTVFCEKFNLIRRKTPIIQLNFNQIIYPRKSSNIILRPKKRYFIFIVVENSREKF